MAAPVVGIDIGSQQIKALELTVSGKEGMTVTNVAVMPTPAGLFQNNILTDPILMGRVIKQMLKESGIRARRAVGCVSGQTSVVVRIIEVPKMSPQELAETMKWEVERHVSFAPNEVQMDYQVLPIQDNSETNPNISVLLAAAQQEAITTYVDMMFTAGLDPIAIDIEPLAAGRALLDIQGAKAVVRQNQSASYDLSALAAARETVAVVNMGAANTDVSIFEDGQLIFPRSLPIAGESLTRAISEMLGYTLEQAERIKLEHGAVIVERMGEYTGSFYGAQDNAMNFQYQEEPEQPFTVDPLAADGLEAFRSPFDQTDEPGHESAFGGSEVTQGFDAQPFQESYERTQPIPRRTLDLARPTPPTDYNPNIDTGYDLGASMNADELRVQVFEAIAPVLAEMATELRRSLEYHRSRTRGRGVDRILLCGGSAVLHGMAQFLTNELQVPVLVATPLTNVTISTKRYDPTYLQSIAPVFTIALGLAAREAVFLANPPDPTQKAPKPVAQAGGGSGGGFKLPGNLTLPSFGKKDSGAGSTTGS